MLFLSHILSYFVIVTGLFFIYSLQNFFKVCSGPKDAEENSSQAVARLKESIDDQVLALQQKITDISDMIVFSCHTHALREAPSGPGVSFFHFIFATLL